MAKDFDDDFLDGLGDFDLFDDDDLLLLDVEDETDSYDGGLGGVSGSQRKGGSRGSGSAGKATKKTSKKNSDYSGGRGAKAVLVILIILVVGIAAVLVTMQITGGNLSNLMFWKAKTEQVDSSQPPETLPAVTSPTPETEPSAETTEPSEETTPVASETPAVSDQPTEPGTADSGDGLALMQTVPASFEQELVGVDNLGKLQNEGNHEVDATIAENLSKFIAAAHAEGYGTMLSTCYKEDVSDSDDLDVQEHGTGLAVDLVDVEAQVKAVFAEECTEEIKWLTENAADYGFILRFPEGKEDKTGVEYMPYHFVYVGTTVAKEMAENDWCLEEYLAQ